MPKAGWLEPGPVPLAPRLPAIVLAGIACALSGCETQQPRSAPATPTTPTREHPAAERPPGERPGQTAKPGYLPPSENAAEVEVTEFPSAAETSADAEQREGQSAPSGPVTTGAKGSETEEGGAETDAERRAALAGRLHRGMSEFDDMLDRQRGGSVGAETAAQKTAGPGGADDGRGFSTEIPPERRGAGGQASVGTGQGNTPDLSGEERRGDVAHVAVGQVPDDIPDERDDDIVARQLREAAMKETDPALREKLWEEYRKYKRGLSAR